ncbi:MAG: pyruvate kinase [Clostridiales bacterium]|nr:pyruvate kinase [Clostridiales bacterium]MDD7309193.1 pyruvate kinase [Eubacteriales bacterium]MDY5346349.1 pyruvate kinase [Eubacteriales bacterium]
MKKTKIICTMGPACSNEDTLARMIHGGMNVARFNFSHGTHEEHRARMDLVKKVRRTLNAPIAIMLDTKGPEYRIRTFANHKVFLNDGDTFTFTPDEIEGDETRVSVSYKDLAQDLHPGDKVLLNNGLVIFEVVELAGNDVVCRVLVGGEISDRKSMSFPNKVLKQAYLSEQDKADLLFGIEMDVDFVACSFVSCKQDLLDVRRFLDANGGEQIDLIAKIENRSGVDNIEEIIDASDGIMVARGDMGVEIPFEELPAIQKHLITTCRFRGKRVITATEMLESMIEKPRPTRAEISDVANAVYDGTSAIMLSGETAMGKYPVAAVEAMSRIAEETEQDIDYAKRFRNSTFVIRNNIDAVSHSTCALSIDIDARLIVVCTRSGATARLVSRFRSPKPIIGMTTEERVWRKLSLSWGVFPMMSEVFQSTDVLFYHAIVAARNSGMAQKGDSIVITGGLPNGKSGNTNLIKLETL